jgi:hypothetical protein
MAASALLVVLAAPAALVVSTTVEAVSTAVEAVSTVAEAVSTVVGVTEAAVTVVAVTVVAVTVAAAMEAAADANALPAIDARDELHFTASKVSCALRLLISHLRSGKNASKQIRERVKVEAKSHDLNLERLLGKKPQQVQQPC